MKKISIIIISIFLVSLSFISSANIVYASEITTTINRKSVVDPTNLWWGDIGSTTSYFGNPVSAQWANMKANFSNGLVNDDLIGTYSQLTSPNNGALFRGWNFDFSNICNTAKPISLTINSHISAGINSDPNEDIMTGLSAGNALPIISYNYGYRGDQAFGGNFPILLYGILDPTANADYLSVPGGVDVSIVYDVAQLSYADLSNVVSTWLVDPENVASSSPVVKAPTASLKYQTCNVSPIATDDTSNSVNGGAVSKDVLTNDSDVDGDTLVITGTPTITSGDTSGTISVTGGVIKYTPSTGFVGTTVITYTISDGNGGTDTATLTITVPAKVVYCPSPGNTSQILTKDGDCDGDGISNEVEGYAINKDSNNNGIPDYLEVLSGTLPRTGSTMGYLTIVSIISIIFGSIVLVRSRKKYSLL